MREGEVRGARRAATRQRVVFFVDEWNNGVARAHHARRLALPLSVGGRKRLDIGA